MIAPPFTFRADIEGTGEVHLAEPFQDAFQRCVAALDWARVYGHRTVSDPMALHWAAVELDAAATAADELARVARTYAELARSAMTQ